MICASKILRILHSKVFLIQNVHNVSNVLVSYDFNDLGLHEVIVIVM